MALQNINCFPANCNSCKCCSQFSHHGYSDSLHKYYDSVVRKLSTTASYKRNVDYLQM